MISDIDKCNFLHILDVLNKLNNDGSVKIYTQKELSKYLSTSLKKVNSFLNGEIFDFWMLTQYAGLLCKEIEFKLK